MFISTLVHPRVFLDSMQDDTSCTLMSPVASMFSGLPPQTPRIEIVRLSLGTARTAAQLWSVLTFDQLYMLFGASLFHKKEAVASRKEIVCCCCGKLSCS